MDKVQSKRNRNRSSQKRKKLTPVRIMLISSLLTLIVGFTFTIIQFLGEQFGLLPVIYLGDISWGASGDAIIIFVIVLLSSVFMGSFLVLFLMRNQLNK